MRLLSQNLIMIFSYCDQREKTRLQALSRQCYNEWIPKTMNFFVIERPFVHLYLAHKKRFLIAYLDNYKAVEVPRDVFQIEGPSEAQEIDRDLELARARKSIYDA